MIIPKVLAKNSGFDPQESIVKLQARELIKFFSFLLSVFHLYLQQEEYYSSGQPVGLDLSSGKKFINRKATRNKN